MKQTVPQSTTERDKQMILSENWGQWPFLPLTKNGELGVLIAGQPTKVYKCNMYAFDPHAPTQAYDTVDEMLNDGWRVD